MPDYDHSQKNQAGSKLANRPESSPERGNQLVEAGLAGASFGTRPLRLSYAPITGTQIEIEIERQNRRLLFVAKEVSGPANSLDMIPAMMSEPYKEALGMTAKSRDELEKAVGNGTQKQIEEALGKYERDVDSAEKYIKRSKNVGAAREAKESPNNITLPASASNNPASAIARPETMAGPVKRQHKGEERGRDVNTRIKTPLTHCYCPP
jgi:hypothetical protein